MNWDAIGAIGEILGAMGVIVTLGYLAVQIRQGTQSSREASGRATIEHINKMNFSLVEQPEVAELFIKGGTDRRNLDPPEALRLHVLLMSMFLLYQNAYFHAQRSEIEPHIWHLLESTLTELLGNLGFGSWWDANRRRLSPEFVQYVEAKRAGR